MLPVEARISFSDCTSPKSLTRTFSSSPGMPVSCSRQFDGLRSLWMKPFVCR